MAKQTKKAVWFRSLLSALISGGAGGVTTGLGGIAIAPETFNTGDGAGKLALLVLWSFSVAAVTGVSNFLKQSPLPPPEDDGAAPAEEPKA